MPSAYAFDEVPLSLQCSRTWVLLSTFRFLPTKLLPFHSVYIFWIIFYFQNPKIKSDWKCKKAYYAHFSRYVPSYIFSDNFSASILKAFSSILCVRRRHAFYTFFYGSFHEFLKNCVMGWPCPIIHSHSKLQNPFERNLQRWFNLIQKHSLLAWLCLSKHRWSICVQKIVFGVSSKIEWLVFRHIWGL